MKLTDELSHLKQWVVYDAAKVPFNARTHKMAESDNPNTWCDYETACNTANQNGFKGIGFVLSESDDYTCIDLDSLDRFKLSPEEKARIASAQQKIVEQFSKSYIEWSPSAKGFHIWCKGVVLNRKTPGIEVFSSGRYYTVTNNAYNNSVIVDCQELLDALVAELDFIYPRNELVKTFSQPETDTDEEVCRQAANGKNGNGEMFQRLWFGNWKELYPSESEADLAFLNIVAFYTNNKEQVARIYYGSDLFRKSKKQKRKNKRDYLFAESYGLVNKAFDQKGPQMDFTQLLSKLTEEFNSKYESELENIPKNIKQDDWTLPSGLLGDIASFVYSNAIVPSKEVALAAAIAYMAGIAGRAFNTPTNSGLNQYIVILAETGIGKEGASQGLERLTNAVAHSFPNIRNFIGPSKIASAQGLIKQLVDTPCMYSRMGEVGIWLQTINGRYAKSNEQQIRGALLELFSHSGAGRVMQGSAYSQKQNSIPPIQEPAYTILGDSTPEEFYKAIDEENVADGLVPRFTVITCPNVRPVYNKNGNKLEPSVDLITRLKTITRIAGENIFSGAVKVKFDDYAEDFSDQFQKYCADKVFDDNLKIWNRAHLRWMRLASLIAVGINPDNPIIDESACLWAYDFIVRGLNAMQAHFDAGTVGAINYELQRRTVVGSLIYKFAKSKYSDKWDKSYGISKEMFDARVITYRYIAALCLHAKCFKMVPNAAFQLKNLLQDFVDSGNLAKVDPKQVKTNSRNGNMWHVVDLSGLA